MDANPELDAVIQMQFRDWIVNSYSGSQDGGLSSTERQRYKQKLDIFFQLVDDMVPGFNIIRSANSHTREVLLDTSDGIFPLDYLSQGMNSTIGWVGVLIHRMYDSKSTAKRSSLSRVRSPGRLSCRVEKSSKWR